MGEQRLAQFTFERRAGGADHQARPFQQVLQSVEDVASAGVSRGKRSPLFGRLRAELRRNLRHLRVPAAGHRTPQIFFELEQVLGHVVQPVALELGNCAWNSCV